MVGAMEHDSGVQPGPSGIVDLSAPGTLRWAEAVLPDSSVPTGSPPPEMAVLGRGGPEGRALWALVRFPPGWARPLSGWYAAEEQVVVLEGRLSVSGVDVDAPGWVCFPPRTRRSASASDRGALALARFSDAPRWVRGEPPAGADRQVRSGPLVSTVVSSGGAVALLEDAEAGLWLADAGLLDLPGWPPDGLEAVLSVRGRRFALGPAALAALAEADLAPWLCWAVGGPGRP